MLKGKKIRTLFGEFHPATVTETRSRQVRGSTLGAESSHWCDKGCLGGRCRVLNGSYLGRQIGSLWRLDYRDWSLGATCLAGFLVEAIRYFLGALTEFADGFASAATHLWELAASKNQKSYRDNYDNMDWLDSEWHMSFLSSNKTDLVYPGLYKADRVHIFKFIKNCRMMNSSFANRPSCALKKCLVHLLNGFFKNKPAAGEI